MVTESLLVHDERGQRLSLHVLGDGRQCSGRQFAFDHTREWRHWQTARQSYDESTATSAALTPTTGFARLHLINPSNPLVSVWQRRQPLINPCGSLSYRRNLQLNRTACAQFSRKCAERREKAPVLDDTAGA